jgi:hypothetical protein
VWRSAIDLAVGRAFAELCNAPFRNFAPLTGHVARVEIPHRIFSGGPSPEQSHAWIQAASILWLDRALHKEILG